MRLQQQYLVIRAVATDDLRLVAVASGYVPKSDPAYTWGGPFKSKRVALLAIENRDESLRRQLYPETPS